MACVVVVVVVGEARREFVLGLARRCFTGTHVVVRVMCCVHVCVPVCGCHARMCSSVSLCVTDFVECVVFRVVQCLFTCTTGTWFPTKVGLTSCHSAPPSFLRKLARHECFMFFVSLMKPLFSQRSLETTARVEYSMSRQGGPVFVLSSLFH